MPAVTWNKLEIQTVLCIPREDGPSHWAVQILAVPPSWDLGFLTTVKLIFGRIDQEKRGFQQPGRCAQGQGGVDGLKEQSEVTGA